MYKNAETVYNGHRCLFCGEPTSQKYCNVECGRKYRNGVIKDLNLSRKLGLNSGETGQINEYIVSIDLVKQGYKIYTPLDTTSSFDLLAFKDNEYYKVQVKTGAYLLNNNKAEVRLNNDDYDILAVVYNLEVIEYSTHPDSDVDV